MCSFCGNGRIEGQEACDDGNNRNGDGCSSDCLTIEPVASPSPSAVVFPLGGFDYRDFGLVSSVKNQGYSCGSGWTFAVVSQI